MGCLGVSFFISLNIESRNLFRAESVCAQRENGASRFRIIFRIVAAKELTQ